jgi:lysophospholipase L1-like esterase
MRFISYSLLLLLALFPLHAKTQQPPSYPFVQDEKNVITNSAILADWVAKMRLQRDSSNRIINFVHIGDSHIQADWLTERIRALFQTQFGNAGRGLIVPCKVAGTNQPTNFSSSGSSNWLARRIVTADNGIPIGIGGITVQTKSIGATITLSPTTWGAESNTFLQARFFCDPTNSFDADVLDANQNLLKTISPQAENGISDVFIENLPTNSLTLRTKQTENAEKFGLFGAYLTNNKAGIIYSAIGVNGAQFAQYNKAAYFFSNLPYLRPDLIILGLGTNEAQATVNKEAFKNEVRNTISNIRSVSPATPIILYTPADSYLRGISNPNLQTIHDGLVEIAAETNCAVWDLYDATGGAHSAINWKTYGLMQKDGIHFTKNGYYAQGELLHQALMKLL